LSTEFCPLKVFFQDKKVYIDKDMKPTLFLIFLSLIVSSFLVPSPARAGDSPGAGVFLSRGCTRCHRVTRPGRVTRAAFLAQKGPDLWYAGSKFKEGFLASWLVNPKPIRPLAYNSLVKKNSGAHPRLAPSEARAVALWLMTLKAEGLETPAGIRPGVNVRGRIVFIKKFACYGCHLVKVRGTVAGGLSGPSLEGARERLNPDWIYAFITNQRAFSPVSRMPVYEGLATKAEMKALASYVGGLE